jgi:hypothetical protein
MPALADKELKYDNDEHSETTIDTQNQSSNVT